MQTIMELPSYMMIDVIGVCLHVIDVDLLTCFRFKMEGDYRVDITMKKIPIDDVSENRYHNFVNGVIYISDD